MSTLILFLDKRRDRLAVDVPLLAWDVEQWAEYPGKGNLSPVSARAFGSWVEDVHRDGNYEQTMTMGEFLEFCLRQWIGGRSL